MSTLSRRIASKRRRPHPSETQTIPRLVGLWLRRQSLEGDRETWMAISPLNLRRLSESQALQAPSGVAPVGMEWT
jgi:hypothetical protein